MQGGGQDPFRTVADKLLSRKSLTFVSLSFLICPMGVLNYVILRPSGALKYLENKQHLSTNIETRNIMVANMQMF